MLTKSSTQMIYIPIERQPGQLQIGVYRMETPTSRTSFRAKSGKIGGSCRNPLQYAVSSQRSAYSSSSRNVYNSKVQATNSLKKFTRGLSSAVFTCFVPTNKKEDNRVSSTKILHHTHDFSTTTEESTGSSSNKTNKWKDSFSSNSDSLELGVTRFSIKEIWKATCNFSEANKIGQGGFGTVYKGVLKDGSVVAVKRAKKNQHDKRLSTEFMNEIQTLSMVEHLNLVRFLGYLEQNDERMIVVEYVSNGTLREHLDGARGDGLELAQRLDIATDVAHAVTYLHMYSDQPIIHRDIKASNILITDKLRAKVADFGFARLAPHDPNATHITTQVKGTAGYMDPEYLKTYQLTEKSDVYSFGVLLVELMTGRHPIEPNRELKERVTTRWAMRKLEAGDIILAMDPKLRRSPAAMAAVEKVLDLAQQCLAPLRHSRPSMKRCAELLWTIRKDYRDATSTTAAAC